MGVGAAIQGKRPVVENVSIDFTLLAMDMIVNQAAKHRFISGGPLPLVIRTQGGTGKRAGMHHSQSLEALYYHVPGLKIAVPATPKDAKGLLKTAIRDDDPVVFIEHKMLYGVSGPVPEEECLVPFGQGEIVRSGEDATIVTWSNMRYVCLEAAELLAGEGISCEVIDLRTLVPMDRALIEASVRRTGRLAVVSEAPRRGSVASDIAAWADETFFGVLRSPVRRICGKVTPVPYDPDLESAVVPGAPDIAVAVRGMVRPAPA
jgi:pyruvate dehydrogenase E1 component beta subunit